MSDWLDSSIVVRTVRRLGQDSILAGAGRAVWRWMKQFDAAIGRAAADKDTRTDDERLRAVLEGSVVFHAIDRVFSTPALAWHDSRARAIYESTRGAMLALSLPQRVRLLGWMVLVALATRIALYLFSRADVTTVTVLLWALVAATSALMMIAPQPVAAAWTEWRARRA